MTLREDKSDILIEDVAEDEALLVLNREASIETQYYL